jgi:DNA polymerase-1
VARILFEKLGLEPGRKGKTGYSTDSRVLRGLRDSHEIVPLIEEWREYSKLLNTYLGPLPEVISPEDGRLHTTFNQTVAATGRLSTSNPNLQSIPIRTELGRTIRSAFVARGHAPAHRRLQPGRAADPRARLREPVMREAFANGEDIHARPRPSAGRKERARPSRASATSRRWSTGIIYGISPSGSRRTSTSRGRTRSEYIDTYLARLPPCRAHRARSRERQRTGT